MNDQGTPGSAEGFSVFAVDADWPQSRQVTGHGHNRVTGESMCICGSAPRASIPRSNTSRS